MNKYCPDYCDKDTWSQNQPRLDLHIKWHCRGKVQSGRTIAPANVLDSKDNEPQYPLTVLLGCCDVQEGTGWGKNEIDTRGAIHDDYLYSIGSPECRYAVLVTFDTKEALLEVLCEPVHAELLGYIPEPE